MGINKNYNSFDLIKFIGCFFVVMIHAKPFYSFSEGLDFVFVNILASVAVPLFFVISGFFLFSKLEFEENKLVNSLNNKKKIGKTVYRLFVLYFLWTLFYFVFKTIPESFQYDRTFISCIKETIYTFFTCGSVFHFWYFVSLIYGILFLTFVLRFINVNKIIFVVFGAYIFRGILIYKSGIDLNFLYNFFSHFLQGLSFLCCGILLANNRDRNYSGKFLGLLFVVYVAESFLLKRVLCISVSNSYILSMLPFAFVFGGWLLNCTYVENTDKNIFNKMRKYSTLIYCIHPYFIYLLNKTNIFSASNSFLQYVLVVICSFSFSYVFIRLSNVKLFKGLKMMF